MNIKNQKTLETVFYTSIAIFVLLLAYFVSPIPAISKKSLFPFVAVLGFIFLLLGVVLIYLTLQLKVKSKLRNFLILTGIFAISPFVFSILHNLFYAFVVVGKNIAIIKYIMEILTITSFVVALIISPVGFLIGAVGSIALLRKKGGWHARHR